MSSLQTEEQYIGEAAHDEAAHDEAAHDEAAHAVHVTVEEAHEEAVEEAAEEAHEVHEVHVTAEEAHEVHVTAEEAHEAHEVHVTAEEAHEAAHDKTAQPKKRAREEQGEMGDGGMLQGMSKRNSGSGITMANAFQGGGRCD